MGGLWPGMLSFGLLVFAGAGTFKVPGRGSAGSPGSGQKELHHRAGGCCCWAKCPCQSRELLGSVRSHHELQQALLFAPCVTGVSNSRKR